MRSEFEKLLEAIAVLPYETWAMVNFMYSVIANLSPTNFAARLTY